MTYKEKIAILAEKAGHDKSAGMSLGGFVVELFNSLNNDEKERFIEEINEILYTSNKSKLLEYAWIVDYMLYCNIDLPGSKEVIIARIMKEHTKQSPDKELIGDLEQYIGFIEKRKAGVCPIQTSQPRNH
jgi:hypothetical protein